MRIDHLGIAVRSIEESLKFYQQALGLALQAREVIAEQGVRAAMLPLGESRLELLEAVDEHSPVARFIAKWGEGLHHICIEVENIEAMIRQLKAAGVRLVEETPRCGIENRKIAFIHPASAHGVLIELIESEPVTLGRQQPAVIGEQ